MAFALPLLLGVLVAAQPIMAPPVPPAPPPEPVVESTEPDGRLVMFLLLDDGESSKGVDGAIIRRVTLAPYDASHVAGVELRILRAQGFEKPAPAWRIGYAGDWTPILDYCPCGGVWDELAYYVALRRESQQPDVRYIRSGVFGYRTETRERQWPVPPSRAIVVRDFIAPRVWRY